MACFAFGVVLLWPRRSPAADPDAETVEVEAGPAERPTVRIAIGALLLFVADVGILHLAAGRPSLSGPIDELRDAGGALGAMIATPLIAATGVVGASVILGGVALVGLLLALGLSIGMIVSAATSRLPHGRGEGAERGAAVAGRREPRGRRRSAPTPEWAGTIRLRRLRGRGTDPEPEPEPEPPGADAELLPAVAHAAEIPTSEDPSGQLVIDLGDDPGAKHGPWKLPPANLLKRGSGKEADRRLIEEGGRILEATLAHHGVEARLVGTTVGPTVTRYELELGSGREGQPRHRSEQRHPVRDGVARRAHPRPDPGPQRGGRRGAEQGAHHRDPGRRARARPRWGRPRPRWASASAATSPARR